MYYNYIRYNTTPQFKSINSLVLSFFFFFLNFILYLFIFIGVQLLNNVVLVSAVQQSEPVTCIFIFTPFLDFLLQSNSHIHT